MAEIPLRLPTPNVSGWARDIFIGIIPHRAEAIRSVGEARPEVDLYSRPPEGAIYDRRFMEKFKLAFDGTDEGAKRHWDLLQMMDPELKYYRIVSYPQEAFHALLKDQFLTIGVREDHQMYDPKGKQLKGEYVALAHFPKPQKPF